MNVESRVREALQARAAKVQVGQHDAQPTGPARSLRRPALGVGAACISILVAALLAASGTSGTGIRTESSTSPHVRKPDAIIGQGAAADPYKPSYPESSAYANVSEAAQDVSFELAVPDDAVANSMTLIGAYSLPGGAVALDYTAPSEPSSYVRQAYIEVYESPWDASRDPGKVYNQMVSSDENPTESLTTIGGLTALVVEPHSPADDQKANPAFVRFVMGNVEIQISGGDDLSQILSIAEGLASGKS